MQPRHWLAFGLLALIWGTTWLGIKFVVREMPPLTTAGVRFAVAALGQELATARDQLSQFSNIARTRGSPRGRRSAGERGDETIRLLRHLVPEYHEEQIKSRASR
ncbi:MAG: hypothetical protein IH793_07645 [Acidobacteria bacterium]|nr:hypothetical protein [Acidobacteriota bacterium]